MHASGGHHGRTLKRSARRLARFGLALLIAALPGCSLIFPIDVDEYAGGKAQPEASDGATADRGGSCFELVASRVLPDPIDPGAYLAGPGIVATKEGFVIAYREQMPGSSKSRLTSVALDDQGMASPPRHIAFDGACSSPIPDDGVGIAWNDQRSGGLAAVSQPDCAMNGDGGTHNAGLTLVGFDAQGNLQAFNTVRGAGNTVSLARGHSIAPLFTSGDFAVLSTIDQTPTMAIIASKDAGIIDPDIYSTQPISVRSSGFAEIDASKDLMARLVVGANEAGLGASLLLDGANAPSGDEAGASAVVDDDLPDGPSGAVVVSGEQALTAVLTASGIDWRMRTLSSAGNRGLLDATSPSVVGVDAAWVGTGAMVVAGRKGALQLFRLPDAASSGNEDGGSTDTSQTMDLSNLLSAFEGDHFAVAGARGLVAVVWLTGHELQAGKPTGGVALFRCP
jgi:hypothetical protein